jgi:hypothetical protein
VISVVTLFKYIILPTVPAKLIDLQQHHAVLNPICSDAGRCYSSTSSASQQCVAEICRIGPALTTADLPNNLPPFIVKYEADTMAERQVETAALPPGIPSPIIRYDADTTGEGQVKIAALPPGIPSPIIRYDADATDELKA